MDNFYEIQFYTYRVSQKDGYKTFMTQYVLKNKDIWIILLL